MAASANLLLDALSKQVPGPVSGQVPRQSSGPDWAKATGPDPAQLSGPDSGLDGSCSCGCFEPPLTSEPPLADAAPLTSEPPLADAAPLTSEPTSTGMASGLDYMGV
ncbi:hypothetical protein DCW30_05100 [Streptomyces alfalfae]|uniref:Uncharacterized protein n=1 Tax=Streptomyces alfalfae TaxID=1642299 RepID=A0A1P8TKX9_9ACTN|nr:MULTISPECIES: hypothetical protein [Streptomyces]AYA18702.1 hypothetical protein D3X13_22885 [Streptomyces fradiae]APY88301.1 hypothetical protein A7J05_23760 [Streptomyces alfalfae]KUL56583.1 hypothetical protein ADL30_12730 [Streptomyces sp. NRRL S-1521]QQC89333.1 hypothetical protein I8755_13560 [Streptomyces alfalfae]QUI31784.1 hypothetical protein H9W91_13595 [Streptomyces alfalfae]